MNNLYFSPAIFLFALVLLWPGRLAPLRLQQLAFALWLCGGLILLSYGLLRLSQGLHLGQLGWGGAFGVLAGAVLLGLAKGQLIFKKSCIRNLARLHGLQSPQRAVQVYPLRSWLMIGLMLLLASSLNWFEVPLVWRGGVNITVGIALIISSLGYRKAY
ncbi:hypothetical protein [Thiorhodospira sibirica]|uniref:hypothetical protein n=1 Tax=Thiorhodospira sibirica TaxID=154347 RepID=UPI00022C0B4A|nr:hypothetical protein [Thiorhodospira sibirica]